MAHFRRIGLAALAVLLSACASRGPQQDAVPADRQKAQPPAPLAPRPMAFPEYHELTLSNGARVVVVEDHEQPLVSISLRIRSGEAMDPAGKSGVAAMTAALLNKGTESRSALEIAEAIDFVGGSLSASASADWTAVGATVLTDFMDTALELVSDVVLRPTFPEEELAIELQRTLSALQVELSDPGSIASRRFMAEIYGAHPYGASMTTESLQAITRDDLVAFHRDHYRPNNALFVVAGDVNADDVVQRLEKFFGQWEAGPSARADMPAPPSRNAREIVLVHKPGTVQAVFRIGHLLPEATHPDWIALDVANQILGGGTTGWLFRVLRGEKGYTYGAYASASQRPGPSYFQASAEVRNEVADSALAEFFRLMAQLRDEPIPAEDLRTAREYMTGTFPLSMETPQQVAGQLARTRLLGLPADYLATYRDRIAAVPADEVQRVAREHIRPDEAVVVVVGDATVLHEKLAPFGPIRMMDVNGKPLQPSDLEVKGASATLSGAAIQPMTLTYQTLFQGMPVLELTTEAVRETVDGTDAFRVTAAGSGGGISMSQEVVFAAADLRAISSKGEQRMGPQGFSYEFILENGTVTGTVTGPDGTPREISAEAVPGMLLPGMSEYVVWAADLAPGKSFSFPSLNALTGTVGTLTLEVVGETTVTVAAGEFEVYEVEASEQGQTVRLFVTKAAPHILIKQEFQGQPTTTELKARN